MKLVPVGKSHSAFVDDADYARISLYRWHPVNGYARTWVIGRDGKRHSLRMHRLIMDPPDHLEVDHWDRNRLNNVRSNLRVCTHAQNSRNGGGVKSTSKFKGVSLSGDSFRKKPWKCEIRVGGKKIYLGRYSSEAEAAAAYDIAAEEHFGQFAFLNASFVY